MFTFTINVDLYIHGDNILVCLPTLAGSSFAFFTPVLDDFAILSIQFKHMELQQIRM